MTNQPLTKMPPGEWETHSLDTNEDHAAALFTKKHGYPPEFVFDRFGYLWMGPIDGKEASDV